MKEIAADIFVETDFAGVNVGAVRTDNGVVCIDAPSYARDARSWAGRLNQLTPKSIYHLILTDSHGDRILNSRWLNGPIVTHQNSADKLNSYDKRYPQVLLDSLSQRFPELGKELASGPVEQPAVSFDQQMALVSPPFEIRLLHRPGPTTANIWVYLPDAGVLFTGDGLTAGTCPPLAQMNSGPWLDSLAALAAKPPDTNLVPGRGPLCDLAAAAEVTAILHEMRERVHEHFDSGGSRETVHRCSSEFAAFFADQPELVAADQARARDWVQKQLKSGLECVYDEIKLTVEANLVAEEAS